ncbi:MAG TPA: Maf family protein, partial [Burkholderiaceae bacterium]|nr:Maf family protein [Burkholderiaceae bacterium]
MRLIVLASSSRYRRELFARLQVPFTVDLPDVDESAQPGESPASLA